MSSYFDRARAEIVPHLPRTCARVLDLGCGEGAVLETVRAARSVQWAAGVELHAPSAEIAAQRFDRLWAQDLSQVALEAEIPAGSLDLILCLDILEHLVEPWDVVRRMTPLLAPGGRLIVSVPNIRNWKFIWRLLMRGDFRYVDAGLLDRTHLRFFTMTTAAELACAGGLTLHHCGNATRYRPMEARALLTRLSGGRLTPLLAKQVLVVAEARAA
jgi:2-polyprenyl-3-methyl-5-hydroxy-6-metoxy-1,4-benzoquinol methylase